MAECPYCRKSPAYISFNAVECSNKSCDHYSKEAYPEPPPPPEEEDEHKTQYLWSMYHNDFGD